MTNGNVIELRKLPPGPSSDNEDPDAFVQWFISWMGRFFDETQIIIDVGSQRGVKKGDYFAVIQSQTQIKNLTGEELGNLQEEGSLIKVAEVHPKFSVCTLEEYRYRDHIDALPKILSQFADKDGNIDIEEHLDVIGPIVVGQQVFGIPQEEKAARDAIEELYSKTLSDAISGEEKSIYYREMARKADAFLLSYSQGYFASSALFQKGYAQFQLGEYQNAIGTFEFFLERYPFNVSAGGARDWVAKANNILQKEKATMSKERPTNIHNPWISGSFYLVAFVIVVVLLMVVANTLPLWALPIVIIGALLAISIIGAFQLRQDERLSQKNFLELMLMTFKRLPLISRGSNIPKDKSKDGST